MDGDGDGEKTVPITSLNLLLTLCYRLNLKAQQRYIAESLAPKNDGFIELADCGALASLVRSEQAAISNIDRKYVHNLVKVAAFLREKKETIQTLYVAMQKSSNFISLSNIYGNIESQKYTYNLVLLHGLNMTNSLLEGDMVTFYEIYESFDKLSIFNSEWENQIHDNLESVNVKLDRIEESIIELIDSVKSMEANITKQLSNLTSVTQSSIAAMGQSINARLDKINSGIVINNILSAVQVYQLHSANKRLS
jgi:hypothetical protein